MKHNIRYIILLVATLILPRIEAANPVFNYVGFSAYGGVSQFRLLNTDIQNQRGGMGGIAFQYKLEQGAFRFVLGADATYVGNGYLWHNRQDVPIIYPDPSMTYHINYKYIDERQHVIEVGARAMIGATFEPAYILFGVRAGLPVWTRYNTTAEVMRFITDTKTIDEYTDMPTHGLTTNTEKLTGELAMQFNPQACFEFGVSFDQRGFYTPVGHRNYTYLRGKGTHAELALYANCSVLSAVGLWPYFKEDIGRCVPWNAGLKINVYFSTNGSSYYKGPRIKRANYSVPRLQTSRPSLKKVELASPKGITAEMPKIALQYQDKTIYTGDKLVLNNLYFDSDKATVRSESKASLNELAKFMKKHPSIKLTLIGHTDNTNTAEYNMKLSQNRVKAVKKELVNRGIASDRITTIGKGQTEPIAGNDSEDGKQQNRRVEMVFDIEE